MDLRRTAIALATLTTLGCASEATFENASHGELGLGSDARLAAPNVSLGGGRILRGAREGKALAFKGIRYAEKPERFGSPMAASVFVGTRDALAYGPSCFQRIGRPAPAGSDPGAPPPYETIGDEDCLFLNVWTPADLRPDEKIPVLFFLHGGGFVTGGSSYNPWFYYGSPGTTDFYDGRAIAERSRVAVVTVNYRLGALGFTAHPALRTAQGSSGNAALEDAVLALEWVRANIAAFGGDPTKVMAFGESAGSAMVCALLTTPRARGLFSRAGMESLYCGARSVASAEASGARFAERLGCTAAADVAACMRSKTKEEIAEAQGPQGAIAVPSETMPGYAPVADGATLPEQPLARIRGRRHNAVPMIVGSNAKEASLLKFSGTLPKTWSEVETIFTAPELAPEAAALKTFYAPANFPTPADAVIALATDTFMTCPLRQTVRALAASQSEPVHRYVFDADVPAYGGALGLVDSFHGAELFYVFQNMNDLPWGLPSPAQLALERRMLEYWTTFAKGGRPSATFAPSWARYDATTDDALLLGNLTLPSKGYHAVGCDAYDRLSPSPY